MLGLMFVRLCSGCFVRSWVVFEWAESDCLGGVWKRGMWLWDYLSRLEVQHDGSEEGHWELGEIL